MAGLSKKAWTGYYAETTSGASTPQTVAPTVFAPAKGEMKFMRASAMLDEDRGTRDENYGMIYGIRHADISLKSDLYVESVPYPVMSAIGHSTDTVVVAGANKHLMIWDDFPRTLAVYQSYDTAEYFSNYAQTEKFDIKVTGEGKSVEFNATVKGLYPIKKTTPDTPNFFSPVISSPEAGYYPKITLDGGSTSTDIMDFEFAFEQKLRLWTPVANSPDFIKIYPGSRKATVSFTARFDNDTYFNKWLAITNTSTGAMTFDVLGDLITGSTFNELSIAMPLMQFTDMELDKSKENVVVKVNADLTSNSAGLFTLFFVNSLTSMTN